MNDLPAPLCVMKFGGTSVGSAEAIRQVGRIMQQAAQPCLMVVSAQSGVTDRLLSSLTHPEVVTELAAFFAQLLQSLDLPLELEPDFAELQRSLNLDLPAAALADLVASFGERLSAKLIACYLGRQGLPAVSVAADDCVVTDAEFGNARYLPRLTRARVQTVLGPLLEAHKLPVVTGFIGATETGWVTTLGRGGSDLTASILAEALNAERIEIWSDAEGVLSADPRLIPEAQLLRNMQYDEAVELSNFGGKILYSRSLIPAMRASIPLHVRNTFHPEGAGTTVGPTGDPDNCTISQKPGNTLITVKNPEMIAAVGYLAKLFEVFEQHGLSIDAISVSEASVSVTLGDLSASAELELLQSLTQFGQVSCRSQCTLIAIISPRLAHAQWFERIFRTLRETKIPVELISYANGGLNLTLAVDETCGARAVRCLHDALISSSPRNEVPQ